MKRLLLIWIIFVVPAFGAEAAIRTYGNLTTDTNGSVITDVVTGREYLRFDEFDLSYADTVLATSTGGIYEDWSIATSEIGDDFIESLLGNPVAGVPTTHVGDAGDPNIYSQGAGFVTGWNDGDFGATHSAGPVGVDFFAFVSTQQTTESGNIRINDIGRVLIRSSFDLVQEFDDWGSIADLDSLNASSGLPVNLLLYRDSSVPEPTAAIVWSSLFCLGLLINRRQRKTTA